MLDIQLIRDNPKLVQEKSKQKLVDVDITQLLGFDSERRELLKEVEELRRQRNEMSGAAHGQKPSEEQVAAGRELKEKLGDLKHKLAAIEKELNILVKKVPNMPSDDVPVGYSEEENVVVKTVGAKPEFDFIPRNHWELGVERDWIDKDRAAKVSGSRFAYLKGELVQLQFALINFGISVLTNETVLRQIAETAGLNVSTKPFVPVLPPPMIRTDVYEATGRLNGAEVTYKLEDDDLWLNGSAEHSLCAMYQDETLDEADMPIRYVGYATSFRREAGTYGKDMEGIIRMHHFDKLEMEAFTAAEDSMNEHLFMIAIQEYLMQQLGLPYQVIMKCTADIGTPNARGVDIDTWLPGQGTYRETHSADLITDYQTRGLRTRLRRKDGRIELAHTNDATAFSQRPLIAIIENFQTAEGKVRVPPVLQIYMAGRSEI